ncbi:hypothetical protein JD844_015180 [Phrynosoma platyrhinos]|uniref:Ig-like domain-containing protein n=1 Tax=Phrynosoma platyrhinos TaxID=52577 RepID=A0ABQ7T8M0_PHRPL|nr:hypothetical protein JD844_015180 [Phrynosoma platyrhinos]
MLIQPTSQSVPPGQMARLSCTVSNDPNNLIWLLQRPRQPPRKVHCQGCDRGPGIPDRFTASQSENVGYLTITNVEAEDEATYYCVHSQGTVTQPATESVSPGQTIKLSCSRSSDNWYEYVSWIQQKSAQTPRFVHCNGCSNRGDGIPNRFTASASGNDAYLTITNVEAEDEADYYCVTWSHSVRSQPTVTQPASESASPGQTIRLSCSRSSGNWDSYFRWIRQKSGETPQFVHCNGCSRGEGIPDRFTVSASGNTGQLTITNAQAEDEADYYCLCFYNTDSKFHSVCSQPTVTQPAFASVSPGQTTKLTCTKSPGSWYQYISWVRQKSGQGPGFVHCNGCSNRGEGIPDRFTASASGNDAYLTIANIQDEDEGDYYCAAWSNSANVYHSS